MLFCVPKRDLTCDEELYLVTGCPQHPAEATGVVSNAHIANRPF